MSAPQSITPLPTSRAHQLSSLKALFPPHRDFSALPLNQNGRDKPLFVCPNGRIFLEKSSPIYQQAYDFLIAIAEPICRPDHVHEYTITSFSLYAAASLGLDTQDIIRGLRKMSKVRLRLWFILNGIGILHLRL